MMNPIVRRPAYWALSTAAWCAACFAALAQEDPFGAAAPKPAAATPMPKAEAAAEPAKRDPLAIELLRASAPAAPPDLLRAANIALMYGRAEEAKQYLAKLVAGKPADEALAPLAARYAGFLLEASRAPELQPEGKQAADLVLGAAQRTAAASEQIAAAITGLSDESPIARQASLRRLHTAGAAAVNPLLKVLADGERQAQHAAVRAALVELAAVSEWPLVAALDTRDEALRQQVVAMLGRMRSRRAAGALVRLALDPATSAETRQLAAAALSVTRGAVPDLYEADKFLRREINALVRGELPLVRDADDRVQLWSWDDAAREATSVRLPSQEAELFLAARAASDLAAIKPADPTVRRLMLLTNLDWAKTAAGLGRPLPFEAGTPGAAALAAGAPAINQVLADALAQSRVPAAIAACELLAIAGDASVLAAPEGQASPLGQAATSPDRRVRLAAALAAVRLAPAGGFAGAGRVVDALAWFAPGGRENTVLVGHPRSEEARDLVGLFNTLGYEGDLAYSGRAVAERAFENPDIQFILVTDAIDSPPVAELVQWLRRDDRTAHAPVAVLARGERLDDLRDFMAGDPFTVVLPRIHSQEVAASTIDELKRLAGRRLVERGERGQQAKAALAALAELAKIEGNFARLDLLRHDARLVQALNQPELAASAALLLGQFGTPAAQTALVDFASQDSRAIADRQEAATAFSAAVKARGLRLTQQQIARQYDRYNASARRDRETQDVLAAILDAIEAPAASRGELTRPK